MTCFSARKVFKQMNHIITDCQITYENGARVKTSFVTSYSGGIVAQTAPDLTKEINQENDRLIKANVKELPKYDYPMNVITAAMMQRYARYGVDLKIYANDCHQVGGLDAQKRTGKSIFGSGLLLCERAAAERAAATRWELSDREKAIIQRLGRTRPPCTTYYYAEPGKGVVMDED